MKSSRKENLSPLQVISTSIAALAITTPNDTLISTSVATFVRSTKKVKWVILSQGTPSFPD